VNDFGATLNWLDLIPRESQSGQINQGRGKQRAMFMTSDSDKDKALHALDVLSAQIGNARLRKMWKKPIYDYIMSTGSDAKQAQDDEDGRISIDEGKDDE